MPKLTDRQCDIISALAFCNMNISAAARELGCHRNSMAWHIGIIKKKTELDPLDFFDLQELYAMAGGEDDADQKAAV